MNTVRYACTLFTFLFTIVWVSAQKADTMLFDNRLQIEQWIKENHVPALGIGLIKAGALSEIRMYGEVNKGVSAPTNALFNVASLTKPIVTLLTLKLVSNDVWNLDEPLSNYWVDPDIANDPRHKKLTTRLVLSHQTGFKKLAILKHKWQTVF